MKHTNRRLVLFALLALLVALVPAAGAVKAQKTVVTWFVGLGTGTNEAQIAVQKAVVEKFNASQNEIELKLNIAASNQVSADALSTLLASGEAPDIVGPVGFSGANAFSGQWMDLKPLADKAGYDLKQYPEGLVQLYDTPDGLVGIPFAVFPALMFYNKDLFDEAELAYPPTEFGAKYMLDGKEVDWDWNTVAEIARLLTFDANGNDPTNASFDPTKIEQFGFIHQWGSMRADFSTFGGGFFYDAATGKVSIPEWWRANAEWTYNALWKDYSIPTATYENGDLLRPSAFASGKVAMARVQLWYTCCLGDLKAKWDVGIVPSYQGKYHAPVDADTFRIMKASKNADAAFKVLTYLQGEAALDLLTTYGGFPALPSLQESFVNSLKEKYPSAANWAIIPTSLQNAAVPNHEYDFPNFNKGQQRFADFRTLLYGDTGKDIDLKAELDKLEADLQAIVDEAKK
jgi:multiple sugar transport system substrate-binding protein